MATPSDPIEPPFNRPCRFCVAAYKFDAEDCGCTHRHTSQSFFDLATAFARLFQDRHPSDEQIGWFLEDADAVYMDFTPPPEKWKLRRLPADDTFLARFRINDVTYVIEDGEGHCTPVRLALFRQWKREAEANYG